MKRIDFLWLVWLGLASCASDTLSDPNGQLLAPLTAAEVPLRYDRNDPARIDPFPDDYFLVSDANTPSGQRVEISAPDSALLQAASELTSGLDGMSPLAPIVLALPSALDATSIPRSTQASVASDASIALFDADPSSPEFGRRTPFFTELRGGPASAEQVLLVFPALPLRPRGHYALVVTRGARCSDGRKLGPSEYMRAVLQGHGATDRQIHSAALVQELLPLVAAGGISADDIALLLRITIRSNDHVPDDLLAVRQQLRAAAPPRFRITSATPPSADQNQNHEVAAIVTGEWLPLSFHDGDFLARDSAGRPRAVGVERIPFTLVLPRAAQNGAVPLIMYQHGQPGSAEAEAPLVADEALAAAGFAVIGFTDYTNRSSALDPSGAGPLLQLFVDLLALRKLPDYLSRVTLTEQLAFLRLIPSLASIDVLPLGRPDGRPDVDPAQALGYLGISAGAQHGMGLLAFAPEIHAADLSAAGGRLSALFVQQIAEEAYSLLSTLTPELTRVQLYTAIALLQMGYDDQDPLNLAYFLRRAALPLEAAERACVLLVEGLGDKLVPVYSTRTAAAQLELVQLQKAAERVDFLPSASAPLVCDNIHAQGALFQLVARGYPGVPATPGCQNSEWGADGHRCAHHAAEALAQRRVFFQTALSGSPEIIDPLP